MFKLLNALNLIGGVRPDANIREMFRRRLLGVTCLLLGFVTFCYIVFWSASGVEGLRIYPFLGLFIVLIGSLVGLRLLRTEIPVERVGWLLAVCVVLNITISTIFQGGFVGMTTTWFVVAPLLAAYMARPTIGIAIAALLVGIETTFYLLNRFGVPLPNTLSPELIDADRYASTVASVILATIFMSFYSLMLKRSLGSQAQLDQVNRHLEQRLRIKTDFLAMISEDLSVPLLKVQREVDELLAGDGEHNDEQQKQNLSMLLESSSHLRRLIMNLSDLERLDANEVVAAKARFSVSNMVRNIVDSHRVSAIEKGINLVAEISSDIDIEVLSDSVRLRQILDNLMTNAIKYSDSGEVKLKLRRTNAQIVIEVSDEGQGISDENLRTIFQPMYQVNQTDTRSEGVGLGLYLVQRLVELLEGKVSVQSELGTGSTFVVTLPSDANMTSDGVV